MSRLPAPVPLADHRGQASGDTAPRAAGATARSLPVRLAITLGLILLALYAAIAVAAIASNWYFYDARGYWETAVSLREGGDLYPAAVDPDDPFVYRYAPWFAWLWVALTFLPQPIVFAGWVLVLAAASGWLLWQLPRSATGLALALLFGPMLLRVVSQGNVQPLMVALIAWGLWHRSGPIWIGLAASLKLVPIILIGLYMVRGEYVRAAVAVVIGALLWAPAALHGIEGYPVQVGGESYPFGPFTFVLAAAAFVAIFVLPDRYRALAAGLAVSFGSPRWIPYNPTYLLVALRRVDPNRGTDPGRATQAGRMSA